MQKTRAGRVSCLPSVLTGCMNRAADRAHAIPRLRCRPIRVNDLRRAPARGHRRPSTSSAEEVLLPSEPTHRSPSTSARRPAAAGLRFGRRNTIAPVALAIGAGYCDLVCPARPWNAPALCGDFDSRCSSLRTIRRTRQYLVLDTSDPDSRVHRTHAVFYVAYANFTGIAIALIVATMIIFPDVVNDISDAAKLAYATSTLNDVDVNAKLRQLETMMTQDKVFQNENLNLSMLAAALQLSGHQLSEMINTQYEYGFSRYIREQRVAEAKRLLTTDLSASVLSISLTTGFKSQSNFYAAFREITGVAPGAYRKNPDPG